VQKKRYKCPFCNKRFKDVPQRTIHSPFPSCPRCGVPVNEDHMIQSFDRTRKVLRVIRVPALAPFKLVALIFGLGFAGTKVSLLTVGRFLWALVTLPINIVREYRKKRFASPEVLERYLEDAKKKAGGLPDSHDMGKKDAPVTTEPKKYTDRVRLSEWGRKRHLNTDRSPHKLQGSVVSHDKNRRGKRDWFIRWDNGKVGGPFTDEDVEYI
jgi:hypothetical protein